MLRIRVKSIVLALVLFACFGALIVVRVLPTFCSEELGETVGMAELTEPVSTQTTEGFLLVETEAAATNPSVVEAEPTATESSVIETKQTVSPETEPTQPSVTYAEVNETVYATSSVNIRTGPGTEHNKIGQLQPGQSVKRIGIADNGWSKVIYSNDEAYISSNYLTTEEPHIETVSEEMARRGNIGRLKIPSVGLDVALFDTSIWNLSHSQAIVDRSDSAAYMADAIDVYGFTLIGDHRNQGFELIKKSVINSTIAYIDRGTCTESYICTDKFIGYNGYNGRTGLFNSEGNPLYGMNDGGFCMYTCNPDGTITITFWQSVS